MRFLVKFKKYEILKRAWFTVSQISLFLIKKMKFGLFSYDLIILIKSKRGKMKFNLCVFVRERERERERERRGG